MLSCNRSHLNFKTKKSCLKVTRCIIAITVSTGELLFPDWYYVSLPTWFNQTSQISGRCQTSGWKRIPSFFGHLGNFWVMSMIPCSVLCAFIFFSLYFVPPNIRLSFQQAFISVSSVSFVLMVLNQLLYSLSALTAHRFKEGQSLSKQTNFEDVYFPVGLFRGHFSTPKYFIQARRNRPRRLPALLAVPASFLVFLS